MELVGAEQMTEIVNSALSAQPLWEEMPLYERGEILYRFADLLEANGEQISQLSSQEMAKPIQQARVETEDGIKLLRELWREQSIFTEKFWQTTDPV